MSTPSHARHPELLPPPFTARTASRSVWRAGAGAQRGTLPDSTATTLPRYKARSAFGTRLGASIGTSRQPSEACIVRTPAAHHHAAALPHSLRCRIPQPPGAASTPLRGHNIRAVIRNAYTAPAFLMHPHPDEHAHLLVPKREPHAATTSAATAPLSCC